VVGRVFREVSIKTYMDRLLANENDSNLADELDGRLTKEQVRALEEREKSLYGPGGDVKRQLPRLQNSLEQEVYRRLMPGYVRRFVENAAPQMDFAFNDTPDDGVFTLRPLSPGALDALWAVMESYPQEQRGRMTFDKSQSGSATFLHPGEPLFDRLRALVCERFSDQARRGGVFIDPSADQPYLFHLARVELVRQAGASLPALSRPESLEVRLVGLRQSPDGTLTETPVESLLLLRGGDGQAARALDVLARVRDLQAGAETFLTEVYARGKADERRAALLATLSQRLDFLGRGYTYQENELLSMRARYREKADQGDPRARGELTKIKERQRLLQKQREQALAALQREPALIAPGEITFLAHALVLPSADPQDIQQRDDAVEAVAVQVAVAYEEAAGAKVLDVSTPEKARRAGLGDWPGFDLLSRHPNGEEKAIEVKGRARGGAIHISENEWSKSCNLRDRYWLFAIYDCATPTPLLRMVNDPFQNLLVKAVGGVEVSQNEIMAVSERDK